MTTPDATPDAQAPLCEPLCDEPRFAELVEGLVADCAPRLFALLEEEGERVNGHIVAWGMAFEDHANVVGVDQAIRGSFNSADSAREFFSCTGKKMRLVWYNPDAATPR